MQSNNGFIGGFGSLSHQVTVEAAKGENPNEYYQVNAIRTPLISEKNRTKRVSDFTAERGRNYLFEVQ
ncbi:hypothetical protein [Chryseobacterium populi]|uniref:hypothetical protein n=1 Tax=Chryseobacterium populi TaxID=1144316 RepID=UPI000318EF4C|nr:hypothetical protein [Chryseobacterium populi]